MRPGKRVRPNRATVTPPVDPFTPASVMRQMTRGQTKRMSEMWVEVIGLADVAAPGDVPVVFNIHTPACLRVPVGCICEPGCAILRVGARA